MADPELAERHRIRMAYWQSFAAFLSERNSALAIRRPIRTAMYRFSMGRPGFRLVARISIREQLAAVGLTISRDPDRNCYYALLAERAGIEAKFGEPLKWDEKPGTKRSLISVTRIGVNPGDSSQYPDVQTWMLDRMERFRKVFGPLIALLPASSTGREAADEDEE
jgi:hypothetical protein